LAPIIPASIQSGTAATRLFAKDRVQAGQFSGSLANPFPLTRQMCLALANSFIKCVCHGPAQGIAAQRQAEPENPGIL
jgi:hypothetical protein